MRSRKATRRSGVRRHSPSGLRYVRGRARRIVTIGDPDAGKLRERARDVPAVDGSIRKLIADMRATMRRNRGIGLAAPQIGVPLRVLVAGPRRPALALVNPRFRERRGRQVGPEGCLSIPGIYADVRRARHVVVDGRNAQGRRVTVRGSGLFARVLQHEIDHLNGVLFIDRVSPHRLVRRPRPLRAARRRSTAGVPSDGRRMIEVKTALRHRQVARLS
jgi:peptide deformylase